MKDDDQTALRAAGDQLQAALRAHDRTATIQALWQIYEIEPSTAEEVAESLVNEALRNMVNGPG